MAEKEIANWQFADKYYEMLIEMYKLIREAYHAEEYETAFKDMEQITIHLHREIELNEPTKSKVEELKGKIRNIYKVKDEFRIMEMNENMPDYNKLIEVTIKKREFREKITELYYDITGVISDLNMFIPKIVKRSEAENALR